MFKYNLTYEICEFRRIYNNWKIQKILNVISLLK